MNRPLLPSKTLILLVAACLMWIAILSASFVVLLGTGLPAGWILAGALLLALGAWSAVMISEFNHAGDDPEKYQPNGLEPCTSVLPRKRSHRDRLGFQDRRVEPTRRAPEKRLRHRKYRPERLPMR